MIVDDVMPKIIWLKLLKMAKSSELLLFGKTSVQPSFSNVFFLRIQPSLTTIFDVFFYATIGTTFFLLFPTIAIVVANDDR